MALVISDLHGNYEKAKAFLEYKPEELHVFGGDYTDSYSASDDQIIDTMKIIFESNSIILSGNHCLQYFRTAGMFTRCSGYRGYSANLFINLMEKYKDKIQATHIADNFLICHGGIHKLFGRSFDNIEDINKYCNEEFDKFKYSPIPQVMPSSIFNIGTNRGGWHNYSGIFWASFGWDEFDTRFNIVCGHTHSRSGPGLIRNNDYMHVCVDCPQYICFNTKTKTFEDFFPKGKNRDLLEISY